MLTTIDNPYDPNKDFDAWLVWDHDHGYYTSEYLARLVSFDEDESDEAIEEKIKFAINEIVSEDVLGIYKIS